MFEDSLRFKAVTRQLNRSPFNRRDAKSAERETFRSIFSVLQESRLLAACEETSRFRVCPLPHSWQFGFVSDFELRISDFRLRRAALLAVLRFHSVRHRRIDTA